MVVEVGSCELLCESSIDMEDTVDFTFGVDVDDGWDDDKNIEYE